VWKNDNKILVDGCSVTLGRNSVSCGKCPVYLTIDYAALHRPDTSINIACRRLHVSWNCDKFVVTATCMHLYPRVEHWRIEDTCCSSGILVSVLHVSCKRGLACTVCWCVPVSGQHLLSTTHCYMHQVQLARWSVSVEHNHCLRVFVPYQTPQTSESSSKLIILAIFWYL